MDTTKRLTLYSVYNLPCSVLYKYELTEYSEHWEIGVIPNPTLPVRHRIYQTTPRAQSQYVQGWDFNPASQPQSSCSCRLLHVTLQFIHSSVQDCQLSSYPRVKTKICVTANKALVQGSPLPLFLHLLQLVWLLWWAHPICACSRVSALTVPSTWRVSSSRQLQGWHLHFITVSTQMCSPQWGLPAHPIPDYISAPTLVFSIPPPSYIFSSKTFITVKWVYNYSFIYYLTPPSRVHFSWELESVCFVL